MIHSFSVVRYVPGLEDGYVNTTDTRTSKFYRAAVVPFIYDQHGNKQYVFDGDFIVISDNKKTLRPREALKFAKYM